MLPGPEKAVLFLLSLDEDVARSLVGELSTADLKQLRSVAATMQQVPAGALLEAYREFLERAGREVALPRGGLPYLRKLSASAIGELRASEVFEDGAATPFARLEAAPPDSVASLLANEPPQLVAALLARLEPKAAALILTALPAERQSGVVLHVSRMTELPSHLLDDIAEALAAQLPVVETTSTMSVDGVARAAAMLNAAGSRAQDILRALEGDDGPLAEEVRMALFTFDDLKILDSRSMREVLREVPVERLTIALKDASPEVTTAIFAGLSERASQLIRDDLELLTRVKKADITAARREVVDAARRLEAEGKIDLGRGEA